MKRHFINRFFTSWMLVIMTIPVQAAWAASPLDTYIAEGLAQNKDIRSLESKLAALKAEINVAGSLDDPKIGFGLLNLPTNSYRFDQEPMTQKQIFISQKLPWFGKLDLKSQQAALKAERQAALIEAKKLELVRKVAVAYYQLSYLDAALATNKRMETLVTQAQQVAETQYATGRGLQQDILQAQVELSKLQDEALMLAKMRRNQEDVINALLNRETFMTVDTAPEPAFDETEPDEERLREAMLGNNPWLKMNALDIEIATRELDLAEKDYWPDMDVRLAYGQRDENAAGKDQADFLSASVMLNIPLWQKTRQGPKVDAGRSQKEASRQAYDALRINLSHRLDSMLTDLKKEKDSYRLFKGQLIPQTQDWSASALAAYEVGKVDFDTMINARLRVLRSELQARKYHFEVLQKRAELNELVAKKIETGEM